MQKSDGNTPYAYISAIKYIKWNIYIRQLENGDRKGEHKQAMVMMH